MAHGFGRGNRGTGLVIGIFPRFQAQLTAFAPNELPELLGCNAKVMQKIDEDKMRAKIIDWDLTLTFRDKSQAIHVVNELMQLDICFPVSYRHDFIDTGEIHMVVIDDMSWAANLATVAEIVRAVDFDSSEDLITPEASDQ